MNQLQLGRERRRAAEQQQPECFLVEIPARRAAPHETAHRRTAWPDGVCDRRRSAPPGRTVCLRCVSAVTSGLAQSSIETLNVVDPGTRHAVGADDEQGRLARGRTRQIDCARPRTSRSHCSACCVQSAISVRLTKPSSRRTRAARISSSSPAAPSTATRMRGRPVNEPRPLRLAALAGVAPTATSAARRGGDWS